MSEWRECLHCEDAFPKRGEAKKFCSGICRSAYHNEEKRIKDKHVIDTEKVLRHNRKLLQTYHGLDAIPFDFLVEKGFKLNVHTGKISKDKIHIIMYYDMGLYQVGKNDIKIVCDGEL